MRRLPSWRIRVKGNPMYEDYEVHKTFPPAWVGVEVIAVLKNGNKGPISSLEAVGGRPTMFQVQFSETGTVEVSANEIDHYLTPPKPERIPDHEGLWQDAYGNLWVHYGYSLRLVKREEDVGWTVHGSTISIAFAEHYAPFTEMEVKEKDQ